MYIISCILITDCIAAAVQKNHHSAYDIWSLKSNTNCCMNTHSHPFNSPLSGTTRVSQYQKGQTNLDFTEARDSEWQWHQLGHMQVCILLQTDNHTSTPPLSFLQEICPSCHPTNSIKAMKALLAILVMTKKFIV